MPTPAQLARKAEVEIQRVKEEVSKLKSQLKQGTLDRNKLESGLKRLQKTLAEIRIPPFGIPQFGRRCPHR